MLLIANWKQNKTIDQIPAWVDGIEDVSKSGYEKGVDIVIAPSFPLIFPLKKEIESRSLNIKIASQDISRFDKGSHTGEVGGFQLSGYVSHVIVGHSERRDIGETSDDINQKIENALKNELKPIICFRSIVDYKEISNEYKSNPEVIFAYEPTYAIGTGDSASADEVDKVFSGAGIVKGVYGGSVDTSSIKNYINLQSVQGFLVGTASLDVLEFKKLHNIIISA